MTDIINEEENTTPLPEEEQETTVVDNGQTYVSEESAIIAQQAAQEAKLWAEESEAQANIATRGAEDAAQAKDDAVAAKNDAVAAKEYAEAAVTDVNVVAVGTDLRATPSNIKTVANNISDVTTVAGISSNVTTVAGNTTNINTVAGVSSNVTTVATNISNVNNVSSISSDVTTVSGISSDVTAVAGNATDISAVAANNTNITAVAGNSTNINAVNANKINIDKVAGDINRVNLVADDIASVHTVAVDISTVIDVANNKTNIDAVAGNETNITAVANNATNINAVNANKTNIDAVAGNNTDISAVAADLTNIDAVAADLTNIDNASANAQLARDWAVKMDGLVASEDYSAKYYADQARQAASGAVVDGITINRNTDDELQTIGIINQNNTTSAIKTWTGTRAQYNAVSVKDNNTLYNVEELGLFKGAQAIASNASGRNIGEIVSSTIPLSDAGLHLLDGSLIQGSGIYADFVTYIAGLVNTYPDLFETESNWQTSVTNYGVCGKFVYDSVNNTVRLPKITGFIEGTTDVNALGDLVEAGLPNITGSFDRPNAYGVGPVNGAFSTGSSVGGYSRATTSVDSSYVTFDASLSNSIYGNSLTVQPQSIKAFYYIVIATSTKTDIEVDIDEIATDLNGKADIDLSNMNPTQTVKNTIVNWGMPDYNSKVTIATTTYEAPCDGYVWYRNNAAQAMTVTVGGIEWYTGTVYGTSGTAIFPISKGETSVASTLSNVVAYFIPLKGVN